MVWFYSPNSYHLLQPAGNHQQIYNHQCNQLSPLLRNKRIVPVVWLYQLVLEVFSYYQHFHLMYLAYRPQSRICLYLDHQTYPETRCGGIRRRGRWPAGVFGVAGRLYPEWRRCVFVRAVGGVGLTVPGGSPEKQTSEFLLSCFAQIAVEQESYSRSGKNTGYIFLHH